MGSAFSRRKKNGEGTPRNGFRKNRRQCRGADVHFARWQWRFTQRNPLRENETFHARKVASSGPDQFCPSSASRCSGHYNDNRKDTKWSPTDRNQGEAPSRAQMNTQQQRAVSPRRQHLLLPIRGSRRRCSIHVAQIPTTNGSRDHHHCPSSNKPSFIRTGTLQPFHYSRGEDKSIFAAEGKERAIGGEKHRTREERGKSA
ncbi:hypothetical protein HPB50_016354 [Hyalomma asiaticum]|uniref:Uncharacterized protein n=1 Tax=Hyalomma asiaticum TaxID=266040 RepID=A0ACB7SN17_HYAAI|nr:hypothetical protein HPB50_016354 [Hyalomma asiaticum]